MSREPDIRLRLVPNESVFAGPLEQHVGDLVQRLINEGAKAGISIEVDTSDRTRPGELRGGASPVEVIAMYVVARVALRQANRLVDAVVGWVLAHRQTNTVEPVIVLLYGPDGEVIAEVEVPQDGRDPIRRH